MSLGNERPEFLVRVERNLWKTLLRIASGAPVLPELHLFLGAYSNLSGMYSDEDRHTDWFSRCEWLVIHGRKITRLTYIN
ncbi:MAG: hypothetical protein QOE33_3758 [Acidobacteriota bacterium]|jgi:hypothetical protein|nr:hypothetical protein [Acidobacteriota bacterium]